MPRQEPGLPSPLTAQPGATVPSGAMITPGGDQGPSGVQGATGAEGPSKVSADSGNVARLGSDSLIFVPPEPLADSTQAGLMHQVSGKASDYVAGDLNCYALNLSGTPVGTVLLWPGATAPSGYLICNGSAVSRTTYSLLYTALGGSASPWGQGDGSTTFNLPDLRGRVPVGTSATYALAATGGEASHTLAVAEMPAHAHADSGHTHTDAGHGHTDSGHQHNLPGQTIMSAAGAAQGPYLGIAGNVTNVGYAQITTGYASVQTGHAALANTGGGATHNNMQPYASLNYVINATGTGSMLAEVTARLAAMEALLAKLMP